MVKSFDQFPQGDGELFKRPVKEVSEAPSQTARELSPTEIRTDRDTRAREAVASRERAGVSREQMQKDLKAEYRQLRDQADMQERIDPALKEQLLFVERQLETLKSGSSYEKTWTADRRAQRAPNREREVSRIADQALEANKEALAREEAELKQLEATPEPKGFFAFFQRRKRRKQIETLKAQIENRQQIIRLGEARNKPEAPQTANEPMETRKAA